MLRSVGGRRPRRPRPPRRHRRHRVVLATVAVAAVVVAGCSGDDSGTAAGDGATTTLGATAGTEPVANPDPLAEADTVFQVGTISELGAGGFEGLLPVGDLTLRGDLGLGTFDDLDGEMVVLDGVIHRVPVSGQPEPVAPGVTTPFAQVVEFEADHTWDVPAGTTCEALPEWIDGQLGAEASAELVALRLDGTFSALTTRSVPAQSAPFPPLADVVPAQQVTFDLAGSDATLVGFRTADALEEVSPPGVHLHGLTKDGAAGGHVLSCTVGAATLAVDVTDELEMLDPES